MSSKLFVSLCGLGAFACPITLAAPVVLDGGTSTDTTLTAGFPAGLSVPGNDFQVIIVDEVTEPVDPMDPMGPMVVTRPGFELGLRARRVVPVADFSSSNGCGTYAFNVGQGATPGSPTWAIDWSIQLTSTGSTFSSLGSLGFNFEFDFDPTSTSSAGEANPLDLSFPDAVIDMTDTIAQGTIQQQQLLAAFGTMSDSFDPDVPGEYSFSLQAEDGGVEAESVDIIAAVNDGLTLILRGDAYQQDVDMTAAGRQVKFELRVSNPDRAAFTAFQSFVDFEELDLDYEELLSDYNETIFPGTVLEIEFAETTPGSLQLNANTFGTGVGVFDGVYETLATLIFTVVGGDLDPEICGPFDLNFSSDPLGTIANGTSLAGVSIPTGFEDSGEVISDNTAPVVIVSANIVASLDADSMVKAVDQVVNFAAATATDNCAEGTDLIVMCSVPAGMGATNRINENYAFPVGTTTVTCSTIDPAGNIGTNSFDVVILDQNVVEVDLVLAGATDGADFDRCIRFNLTDGTDCVEISSIVTFSQAMPGDPFIGEISLDVPCGVYTDISAKDAAHTLYAESPLGVVMSTTALSGADMLDVFANTGPIVLLGGDTDDDGDVDINDISLFIAQFGEPVGDVATGVGTCSEERNADFDNDGTIGGNDYTFFFDTFLMVTGPVCAPSSTLTAGRGSRMSLKATTARLRKLDTNGDGVFDVLDVEAFEVREGLSGELSRMMHRLSR